MASGNLNFKEKFMTCPYNASHSVEPLRMPRHLIKCRKQYPHVKMIICPFNATHHVREENFPAHFSECKDKDVVERDIFIRENPEILSQNLVIEYENSESEDSKPVESWDSEIQDVLPYDSEANIIYKEIPRLPPTGLGKAGRRQWREVDIERIQRLQEGKPIGDLVYPTIDGGEICISDIAGENNSNLDFSKIKNFLLEKNPNIQSSSKKNMELPELPRPKNFQKSPVASKSSDTESVTSDRNSLRKGASARNGFIDFTESEDGENLIERVNAMSISKMAEKVAGTPGNSRSDGRRETSTVTAHRMILRNIKNK